MKRALFLFFILMPGISLFGQNHFTGILRDAETSEPVPGANIRLLGTLQGAVSDEKGVFSLPSEDREISLEISHIGYEKRIVKLNPGEQRPILLKPRDVRIGDVVIHADGIRRVFDDRTLHIFDYAFYDDHLIVILQDRKKRKPVLALVGENDSIVDLDEGFEKPFELFTDCMGNVHALGEKYACQLHVEQGQLLMYRDPIAQFREFVEPCLASREGDYYFRRIRYNGQMAEFIRYDGTEGIGEVFHHVMDREKIHQLLDPHPDNIYGGIFTSAEQLYYMSDHEWEAISKLNYDFMFYQIAMFYPVPAHLKVIDRRVHLFDHTNGEIIKFDDSGEMLGSVPITYHDLPKWKKDDILVDPLLGEAYAIYKDGTWTELREIDLQTGDLIGKYEIPKEHIGKITVRDGVIYFMYRESNYDHTNRLYRWRIK